VAKTPEKEASAEQRILEAAKKVFVKKGLQATTMQDIADAVQISRTSLHYYFRSKGRLFSAVLHEQMDRFIPTVNEILNQDVPFAVKLEQFVGEYLDMLMENPHLPQFMMNELNRDPDTVLEGISRGGLDSSEVRARFAEELRRINPGIPASHFMINMLSMCIFPFITRPIIHSFLGSDDIEAFNRFIEERKRITVHTLMSSLEVPFPKEAQ